MARMDETALAAQIASLVKDCEEYRKTRANDRTRAIEYYDGKMLDVPAEEGRSRAVSRDVRAAIKKVLPSVMRTILGNDKVVAYEPLSQEDEKSSEQATDFINYVIFPESDGPKAFRDAAFDALLCRNGIIKWWYDSRITVEVSLHTGLDDQEFAALTGDKSVEVLEHTQRDEDINGQIVPVHDVRISRRGKHSCAKLAAVPADEFLIHPDALTFDESPIVGHNWRIRRSDLIAMGYDRTRVDAFPEAGKPDNEDDAERQARRPETEDADMLTHAMHEVEYYDLYIRIDFDGDGIAELRRVVMAGGLGAKNILENEYADEVPFADIQAETRPHQWEGTSVADDVMEVQKVKTVLLRQTLDNLYAQNMPQPIVQEGFISNPDAVINPAFGKPIRVRAGTPVRDALSYTQTPFVAKESFAMLEYLDNEITDRTGISDASSGMAPDALQNMTAKATALIEQAGIGQTELMVRTLAEGYKRVFKGLLKLTIRHQDKPRMVRLRNEWVTFDPRHWNANMDATVNTGLGAGTRERDMAVLNNIILVQEKLLAGFGPDNPFVKPENVFNAVSKMMEAAGLRSPDMYVTRPDPQEVAAKLEKLRNAKSPEQQKIEAQMQLEQAKMAAARDKEMAQMEADKAIKSIELEKDSIARREQLAADSARDEQKLAFEREKLESAERLKLFELQQARDLEIMKLNAANMAQSVGEDESVQVGEDGKVMKQSLLADAVSNLSMLIQQMAAQSNMPKRIVRDPMTGDVVGVEPYQPDAMVN